MWSWTLAIIGSLGVYVVGKKNMFGWLILMVSECLWTIYALTTHQYGFIFAVVLYSGAYIKSYLHWRKDERDQTN